MLLNAVTHALNLLTALTLVPAVFVLMVPANTDAQTIPSQQPNAETHALIHQIVPTLVPADSALMALASTVAHPRKKPSQLESQNSSQI